MKNRRLQSISIFLPILVLLGMPAWGQLNVNSSNGYTVHVIVLPTTIIPSSYSCTWGYNYNVRMSYTVTFTGSNIPANLYTLQGTLTCGSSSHFFNLPNNGGVGTATSTSNVWNPSSDCATATVNSLNCNNAQIQINGPGISNQFLSFPIGYSILPVGLISFVAGIDGNRVQLSWSTATEVNSRYFIVERSADGGQWQEIEKLNAAGNSSARRDYQSYDEHPLSGLSYYRLKAVDNDGRTSYLDIRTVRYLGANSISISPVPNSGHTINISGIDLFKDYRLEVINSSGALVYATALNSASVALPGLTPALYIVRISNKVTGSLTSLRYVQE